MRLSLFQSAENIQKKALKEFYDTSMHIYHDTLGSVKSETLKELYTDAYKPIQPKECLTTVKSLKTGEAYPVKFVGPIVNKISPKKVYKMDYSIRDYDNVLLGDKEFGVYAQKNKPEIIPGFIHSYKNDEFSGIQIRLLQAAIELANKLGIKKIPLDSLIPAVKFHTMMGFKPLKSYSTKIESVDEIHNVLEQKYRSLRKDYYMSEVIPILSNKDGDYYIDFNRTLYCTAMKHNQTIQNMTGLRHLPESSSKLEYVVNMGMTKRGMSVWKNRMSGFEILPDEPTTGLQKIFSDMFHFMHK